jgi:hypothetical protein
MSEYVLRLINPPGKPAVAYEGVAGDLAVAAVSNEIEVGKYLEWSDPDAKHGMGDDRWTDDVAKAKRFPSFEAAMACWTATSRIRPRRPDGEPNRPMTAYSVSVEKLEP